MYKRLFLCIVLFIYSLKPLAQGEVTALVKLSPVGSFEVVTKSLKGSLKLSPDGSLSGTRIAFKVKSLTTGISFRDQNMYDSFDTSRYNKVFITNISGRDGKGSGTLTLKGVSKEIKFVYKKLDHSYMSLNGTISLEKFNFKNVNFKGVGVEDDLQINAKVHYD